MNKLATLILASFATLAAASAFAEVQVDNIGYPTYAASAPSKLTRAEVRAEYLRAKAAGELPAVEGYPVEAARAPVSKLTRADVYKEYLRARDAGELAGLDNALGSPELRRSMQ